MVQRFFFGNVGVINFVNEKSSTGEDCIAVAATIAIVVVVNVEFNYSVCATDISH